MESALTPVVFILSVLYLIPWIQANSIGRCYAGDSLFYDRAQVYANSIPQGLFIYAVNADCYKCSRTKVLVPILEDSNYYQYDNTYGYDYPDNTKRLKDKDFNNYYYYRDDSFRSDNISCATMWTPFSWTLYLTNDFGETLSSMDYTFGDQGKYEIIIDPDAGSLSVLETTAPVDSLAPLFVLIGILLAVGVVAFGAPPLFEYWNARQGANLESITPKSIQYSTIPLLSDESSHAAEEKDSVLFPQSDSPELRQRNYSMQVINKTLTSMQKRYSTSCYSMHE